jgi:transposase
LHKLEAVQLLQRMWIEQFYLEDDEVRWRTKDDLPPSDKMLTSPYDPDARYSHKRLTTWIGYKVHLTESCEADLPCLITHVETTSATTQDVEVVDDVHADLAQQDLLPGDHFVDMGYMSSDVLVTSQQQGVDLVGPVRADTSWQAQTEGAYDITQFQIDWEQQTVRCPMGKISSYWREGIGKFGKPNVNAGFKPSDCRPCTAATRCTRNKKNKARALTFPQQAEYQALQAARERQTSDDFKERYRTRSGVEGLISQAAFTLGMRRTRYRGIDKTHLQNLATASAINVLRTINWLIGKPKAKTRISHFAALAA